MHLNDQLTYFEEHTNHKTISIDHTTWTYYRSNNDKPPLLILPGGIATARSFFAYMTHLSRDFRVIIIDIPAVPSFQAMVDGVKNILQVEKIEKYSIIGHAFGGMIAQHLFHSQPNTIEKIIILHSASNVTELNKKEQKARLKRFRKVSRILFMYPKRIFIMMRLQTLSRELDFLQDDERQFWDSLLRQPIEQKSKKALRSTYRSIIDYCKTVSYPTHSEPLQQQMLIIESDEDTAFTPWEKGMLKQNYPTATVISLATGKQLHPIVRFDTYIQRISQFLL